MELSAQATKEAKKFGCTTEDMVFADLLSLGYSKVDAYIISHPEDLGASMQGVQKKRESVLSRINFQDLCEKRRVANSSKLAFSGDVSDIDLIDNEMTAREILKIARQMPENSKERGEMFMKYADLTRKNDQKTEEVAEAINFYFPIKCHQCPLFTAFNDFVKAHKKRGEEVRPVEMESIIRAAKPMIDEARKKAGT